MMKDEYRYCYGLILLNYEEALNATPTKQKESAYGTFPRFAKGTGPITIEQGIHKLLKYY